MNFICTSNHNLRSTLKDAIMNTIPSKGCLWIPDIQSHFNKNFFDTIQNLSFQKLL